MKHTNGLFIFHRDFRISDNKGLIEASKKCKNLHTCFIFTLDQVTSKNKYKSENSIQFMIESLKELEKTINENNGKLHIFYGEQISILNNLIKNLDLQGIYFNKDYTPYAKNREEKTKNLCLKNNIECESFLDYYLYEPGEIVTSTGGYYKKFTPFYNDVLHKKVMPISKSKINNFSKINKSFSFDFDLDSAINKFINVNNNILVNGGRTNALKKLKQLKTNQKNYGVDRDIFSYETTRLSAYLKFGCISVREMYFNLKENNFRELLRQLIWREFYAHVLHAYPEVINGSYQTKFKKIKWKGTQRQLRLWKDGKTGYPLVDACMNEMNTTGYMHNRGRMVVANFLIKVLLIDWREGEKYFAQKLTDYDVASNNGNWQNISSTGVDMNPYFRYMSPWIQSKKHDPNCAYIKKWVPELKTVSNNDIHNWDSSYSKYKVSYPKPIVDFTTQTKKMLEMYESV